MTQTTDAFGSLTALFTSEQPHPEPNADEPIVAAPVVVALVGNMPVMAGLWTTQLADEVARHGGPTALVRFERGEVTVELLRADGRQLPPPSKDAVSRWLPRATSFARRWVICIPAETAPAEVLASGAEILLMTGADDAAKVHAYHRLKHLAEEATHRGEPLGRVGLVVVGAQDDRVDAVAASMEEAARTFLGMELAVVARLPTLDRVQSSARVSYPSAEAPTFEDFMRELGAARSGSSNRFESGPAAAAAMPLSTASATPASAPPPSAPVPQELPKSWPSVPSAVERVARPMVAASAPSTAPSKLVPFLRGVRSLGVACPYAPEVELAIDDAGRVQIVGRADQLARVRTAHTWARQHSQLLALALPEIAKPFTILERLLLNDAREAINLHGSGVLLDLLVQIETPAGPVSTVVPLNDPMTAGAATF